MVDSSQCMLQACIRCGTTSTPQWRPEVLAGPKVLCNACGVKVLYPFKTRQAKPHNDFPAAAGHQSHSGSIAKRSHQHISSISCHEGFLNGNGPDSNSALAPDKHKRQKTHSTAGDVMLSPLQTQYVEIERQYDSSGSNIVRWTITDCTIDDTRDFDHVMHAQAFVDECWAFISTDFRDKVSAQGPPAANHDLELLLAAAAHTPEPSHLEGHTTGQHDGTLREAAAAADQINLSSEPGPSQMLDSPRASPSRQAAASEAAEAAEAAAKAVDHGAETERQLTSSRRSHSSIADACLPAISADNHEMPKQAESAIQVPAPPHWPRHSKQMANVTTLHGGGKRSRPTPAPCPPPPAGFAVKSPPVSPGGRSFKFALDNEQAQRPLQTLDPARIERSPRASCRGPAAGSSSVAGQPSDPTTKPEVPSYKATPALSVSISPQDLPNPTTQDLCHPQEAAALLEATGDAQQQHEVRVQHHAAHPCTRVRGSQEEEPPGSAAGTARHPAAGPKTRQAASLGPKLASSSSAMASIRDASARPASHHLSLSWGLRRPRTRSRPRPSDSSMTDLAVAAAAATAEAEQAAASAVARVHNDYHESASQSDEKPHSHHPQNGFSQAHHTLRSHSLPPRAGSAAHQEAAFASRGYPDANEEPQAGTPSRALGRNGGPRSGRNHHRAGALPSNLHKDLGYIGSNFLGVNGVRHGPDFPLRWKAGTWDPLLKKTVYIGSYNTELEAANAVDSWHVSRGRAPVNFVQPDPRPAVTHVWTLKQQPHEQRMRKQRREEAAVSPAAKGSKEHTIFTGPKSSVGHCMPEPARQVSEDAVPRQAGGGNDAGQPGPCESGSASPDALETAGSRNDAQLGTVWSLSAPESSQGYHPAVTHQAGTDHSQQVSPAMNGSPRQTAAGDADTNAARTSIPGRGLQDGSAVQTHPTRNCRGVILLANGKWRAQIKVEGCMQLLGLFDNKEDAAQTYAVARRQKLLMHVS